MDILDELTNRFADELDIELARSSEHNQAYAYLNDFCEMKLTKEQASELNEIVEKLASAIFRASAKSGMKLGAKLVAELLSSDD